MLGILNCKYYDAKFDYSQLKKPNNFHSLKMNNSFIKHLIHIHTEHIIFLITHKQFSK